MKVIGRGEYSEYISRYFESSFPKVADINESSLLEILTKLLIGGKDSRYGTIPTPENQVVIRKTIMGAIEKMVPIPILIPWGGKKANSQSSIDIAEVSAIKRLVCLDEQVKKFHPQGLHIHLTIEDLGASWLYRTEDEEDAIERYSSDMVKLVKALKGDADIEPIRESTLMDGTRYFETSKDYSELLETCIRAKMADPDVDLMTIPEYVELTNKGWKGGIDDNQRDYYISLYKSRYPEKTMDDYIMMLADYLGGSKARYDLKGKGEPYSSVGSYIKISFTPPIPGAPKGMFSNTLYYRTVPESMGRTHIAPWRAKGYLKIVENHVVAKVTQAFAKMEDIHESYVKIVNEKTGDFLMVECDYIVEDPVQALVMPPTMI